mgnify:FL=1
MIHSNAISAGRGPAAAVASVILMLSLALTGCAGGDPAEPPPGGTDPVDPAPVDDGSLDDEPGDDSAFDSPGAEALARCMEGRWLLDTETYAADAAAYMVSLGPVPLESLTYDGTLLLDITEVTIGQSVDITAYAVLMGIGVTVVDQSVGVGDVTWSDTGFSVTQWTWAVEPTPGSADDPAVPAPSVADAGFVLATCDGSTLVVTGDGAPLTAIFHREGT